MVSRLVEICPAFDFCGFGEIKIIFSSELWSFSFALVPR